MIVDDTERILDDGLATMWAFLEIGNPAYKGCYPELKENCLKLARMLKQKTAGQKEEFVRRGDIPFEDFYTIKNLIVLNAVAFVLSGEYEG